MKKNLFTFYLSNLSGTGNLQIQETCVPCSSECEKMRRKINNRKLSNIQNEEVLDILTPFKY